MKKGPKFSIVIPTKNRENDLERALRSVCKQAKCGSFEIVVVDNGSTDNTKRVAKKYGARVVGEIRVSGPAVFNKGWRMSKGDLIVFLNDDAEIISRHWLKEFEKTFQLYKGRVAAVGGPTVLPPDKLHHQEMIRLHNLANRRFLYRILRWPYEKIVMEDQYDAVGRLFESGAYSVGGSLEKSMGGKTPYEVELLTLTNVAMPKKILKKFGGFDNKYVLTHHDGDLFTKMRKEGYKLIFNPRAAVYHQVNMSGATRNAFFRGEIIEFF